VLPEKAGVCPGLLGRVDEVLTGVLEHRVPTAGKSSYKCNYD
jgi:hypothetical protein